MLFNTTLLSAPQLDGIQNQLDSIYNELETIQRTSPDYSKLFAWDVGIIASISLVVAVISLVYTYRAFKSQAKTEENTSNVTSEAIKGWLKDLIRHFYRNLVVVTAIKKKLEDGAENGVFIGYPSDEHILKLAPLYDWMEMVNNKELSNIDEGVSLFNLRKQFVNFEIELHTILEHFKNRDMQMEVKQRDLSTLIFKSKFLAQQSYEAFCTYIHYLEKPKKRYTMYDFLGSLCNTIKTFPKCFVMFFIPTKENDKENEDRNDKDIANEKAQINATLHAHLQDKNNYRVTIETKSGNKNNETTTIFANVFCNGDMEQFNRMLEHDVEIECGNNNESSPKIFIIKYPENRSSAK